MEVQGGKLEWLNKTEPEVLLDKNVDLQEKNKLSDCLQSLNVRWNKVCIDSALGTWSWKYSGVLRIVVSYSIYLWQVHKTSCKPCIHVKGMCPSTCLYENTGGHSSIRMSHFSQLRFFCWFSFMLAFLCGRCTRPPTAELLYGTLKHLFESNSNVLIGNWENCNRFLLYRKAGCHSS